MFGVGSRRMAGFVRGAGGERTELEQSIVMLVLIRRDAVYLSHYPFSTMFVTSAYLMD